MNKEQKTFLLRVPKEKFKKFKLEVVKNDTNMNKVINELIESYLETKKEALS